MQFDADIVGTPGVAADAEMAMMMADTLEAVGIKRGDYVIRVNNRKVLDGVLEAIGLGGDENAGRRLTVLRAIDKLDKFGPEGVRLLLGKGRLDESGDFTKGAGLDEGQADVVLAAIQVPPSMTELGQTPKKMFEDNAEIDFVIDGISSQFEIDNEFTIFKLEGSLPANELIQTGLSELDDIRQLVESCGYGTNRIRIDPSVVRGLEYYTGPVYEAELLFEVPNEKGEIVRFGSVAGGGRYDGLVSRFRGEPVPATGFSIGVSRLTAALKNLGKLDASDVVAPVVVLVMDKDTEALGRYQKMVAALRAAGIRAEMYLGGAGMKAQMKYADRRGSPCVVIQGGDEREKGEVQIKDLVAGAKAAEAITDNTEWRESRPAQFSVQESELVEAVRGVLASQAAERGAL
jgi:histidyl-tRNA synthetase